MLNVIAREDAVKIVRRSAALQAPEVQRLPLQKAVGRVLAQDIVSESAVPPFDRSTMDGFAVRAADTFGAGASIPAELTVAGEIKMGESAAVVLSGGQCARISTGGMLPAGADAVVMAEHTEDLGDLCLCYGAVAPGENVTKKGDDIAPGSVVLRRGSVLCAGQIGALASLGIRSVPVFQKPRVAVISTGDELVQSDPIGGQICDSNSDLLFAAATNDGCDVFCFGAVKDERSAIQAAVEACLARADIVLISGGSSAGAKDMTVGILSEIGEVQFHGIAMKPGKPTIFGTVGKKLVFGLPGHPLAAYFVYRTVVYEALRTLLCLPQETPLLRGTLLENIPSNHGREELLCVQLHENGGVLPLHTKSGVLSVLTRAQGYLCIDRNTEGLPKGAEIDIYRL